MKRHLPLILLFSLFLLVACGQSNQNFSASATIQPTVIPDRSTATATEGIRVGIAVIPPATWSPTPTAPTKTPRPIFTPTLIQQTKTPDPDTQITEQAYERIATQIASFPATCENSYSNENSISPSGNWLASSCDFKRDQTLEIVSHEGKLWVLHFKDYIPEEFIRDGSTPMGGLYPRHWTSDDEYLYFISHNHYSGGGTCFYGFGVAGLFRVNVKTGTVSTVLPAAKSNHGPNGYDIAFSPGGGKLAYIADRPSILDFRTGDKITIDPGEKSSGYPTWSPDGSELVFSTCSPSDDYITTKKSTIKMFSLDTHELTTIVEVEKNFLRIEWTKGNQKLIISNEDTQTGNSEYLEYDWSSGQITTPTPTPQP